MARSDERAMSILPAWYPPATAAVFGLLFGSFLNVVIYRLPAGRGLWGRSACPGCGHPVRGYDNVPVLSWMLLGGRCRDCRSPISWRYPVLEAACAAGWVLLTRQFGLGPVLLVMLACFCLTFALAFIDLDTMRLPDVLVWPTWAVAGVGLALSAWLDGDWVSLRRALLSAAAWGAFYFLLWAATGGRGLGWGDVKLAPALGLLTGWISISASVIGFVAAFAIGGIPVLLLMIAGVLKRGTAIPYGPFLIAGAWVGVLAGDQLGGLYLRVTGLG